MVFVAVFLVLVVCVVLAVDDVHAQLPSLHPANHPEHPLGHVLHDLR
jgi:hypothetical protein